MAISTFNVHLVKCCIYYLLKRFMHSKKRDFRLDSLEMLTISNAQLNYIPRTFILVLFYLDFRWMKSASLIKVKWSACFYISQRGGQTLALPRHGVRPTRQWGLIRIRASYTTAIHKFKQILTPVETVLVPLCFREIRTESSFARTSYSGRHLSPEWRECSNSFLRTQNKLVSVMLAACPIPINNTI